MPFSLLFSVDSRLHTLFARCSTISAQIVRADYPRPLRGLSAAITRILRGRYADYLRRSARLSARNNHGILQKKLSFPCHVPYMHRNIRTPLFSVVRTYVRVYICTVYTYTYKYDVQYVIKCAHMCMCQSGPACIC